MVPPPTQPNDSLSNGNNNNIDDSTVLEDVEFPRSNQNKFQSEQIQSGANSELFSFNNNNNNNIGEQTEHPGDEKEHSNSRMMVTQESKNVDYTELQDNPQFNGYPTSTRRGINGTQNIDNIQKKRIINNKRKINIIAPGAASVVSEESAKLESTVIEDKIASQISKELKESTENDKKEQQSMVPPPTQPNVGIHNINSPNSNMIGKYSFLNINNIDGSTVLESTLTSEFPQSSTNNNNQFQSQFMPGIYSQMDNENVHASSLMNPPQQPAQSPQRKEFDAEILKTKHPRDILANASANMTWHVKNIGLKPFGDNIKLVFMSGDALLISTYNKIPNAKINEIIQIKISFNAYSTPGVYETNFKLTHDGKHFGPNLQAKINVIDASTTNNVNFGSNSKEKTNSFAVKIY